MKEKYQRLNELPDTCSKSVNLACRRSCPGFSGWCQALPARAQPCLRIGTCPAERPQYLVFFWLAFKSEQALSNRRVSCRSKPCPLLCRAVAHMMEVRQKDHEPILSPARSSTSLALCLMSTWCHYVLSASKRCF